jgi:hypothetical protein
MTLIKTRMRYQVGTPIMDWALGDQPKVIGLLVAARKGNADRQETAYTG